MSGLDPLNLRGKKEFAGNTLADLTILIFSIFLTIFINLGFLVLSVLWLENFGFWMIPKFLEKNK